MYVNILSWFFHWRRIQFLANEYYNVFKVDVEKLEVKFVHLTMKHTKQCKVSVYPTSYNRRIGERRGYSRAPTLISWQNIVEPHFQWYSLMRNWNSSVGCSWMSFDYADNYLIRLFCFDILKILVKCFAQCNPRNEHAISAHNNRFVLASFTNLAIAFSMKYFKLANGHYRIPNTLYVCPMQLHSSTKHTREMSAAQ